MQWQYHIHIITTAGVFTSGNINPQEIMAALDEHGRQGWELVSAVPAALPHGGTSSITLFFKRAVEIPPVQMPQA